MKKIEETLAHHERQIQDLSEMIIQNNAEILKLKTQVLRLEAKINEASSEPESRGSKTLSVSERAAQDKPPHY